jgi:hypothetical protein
MADDTPVAQQTAPAKSAPVVAPQAPDAPESPASFDLHLDEWCQRESATPGCSVELLSAFHADERRAGTAQDSHENFAERYAAFAVRPA